MTILFKDNVMGIRRVLRQLRWNRFLIIQKWGLRLHDRDSRVSQLN